MRGQREDLPRTGDLASPMAASGMGLNELTRSYTMANATVEDFERAVSEARDECNLSRANVVRKIKGTKPKPGERTEWHHNRRHIDSTRILSTLTQELDAATAGLELIEPDDLEEDFVTECAVSIRQSLAVIQATLRRIQRDRRDESGQTH